MKKMKKNCKEMIEISYNIARDIYYCGGYEYFEKVQETFSDVDNTIISYKIVFKDIRDDTFYSFIWEECVTMSYDYMSEYSSIPCYKVIPKEKMITEYVYAN